MVDFMNDPNIQTLLALNLALITQLAGVALAVLVDPYIKKADRYRVYGIAIIVLVLIIEPQITERYGMIVYRNHVAFWNTFMTSISYILRTITLYLFIALSGNSRGKKILYGIIAANAVVCLSAFFGPWVFTFDENGNWSRGPLGYVPFIASFILVLWLVIGSLVRFRGIKRRESSIPIIISFIVVFAVILDLQLGFGPYISFLTVAMTESTVFL